MCRKRLFSGILFLSLGLGALVGCTVTGNSAGDRAGGFFLVSETILTATNTLFDENTAPLYALGFVGSGAEAHFVCCELDVLGGSLRPR